jgi:hypothetical protein
MGALWTDIAEVQRARREWPCARPGEESRRKRWQNLIIWGGAVFGICLLVWGNDTVDWVVGVGLLVGPAVIAAMYVWMYWKAVRMLRARR